MRTRVFGSAAVAAGLVCLLLAPAPARAQGETWVGGNLQQMVESARWRLGEMRVNAAFTLANVGYDSDIYYGFLAERVPDAKASAAVPVQVLLPLSKKAVLDVSESPEYVFYLETERDRSWNNRLYGRLHLALDRVYLQAGGGLSNVKTRLSPELDLNIRLKTTALNGLALWQASRMTSLALLYGGVQYDYGDAEFEGVSLADRLNRNEEFVDLISYVQPSPRLRLSLDGQYGTYEFRRVALGLRDAESFAFFAGVEFIPGERDFQLLRGFRGTASLGYMRLDMRDPLLRDGSGIVGSASVTARLSRRMTGELLFSRGFQFSIFSGSSFFLETLAGATVTRHLTKRASLSYRFLYGQTSYPDLDGEPGTTAGRAYQYLTHGLNLDILLARHLSMSLFGTFGQRDQGGGIPIRSRFFVGFGLVYGFRGTAMSTPTRGGSM